MSGGWIFSSSVSGAINELKKQLTDMEKEISTLEKTQNRLYAMKAAARNMSKMATSLGDYWTTILSKEYVTIHTIQQDCDKSNTPFHIDLSQAPLKSESENEHFVEWEAMYEDQMVKITCPKAWYVKYMEAKARCDSYKENKECCIHVKTMSENNSLFFTEILDENAEKLGRLDSAMRKLSAQIVELERVNTSHLQQDEEIRNMSIALYQDDVIIPTARERLFAGLGINLDNEDSE